MTVHIGVDQHKVFSQVAVVDEEGQVLDNRRLEHSDRDGMRRYFARWGPQATAVLEATRNWYWLYELLEGTVGKTKLAHPAQVRLITDSKVKTDKIDGNVLAQLDRIGFLPQAYIPPQLVLKAQLPTTPREKTPEKTAMHFFQIAAVSFA